MRYTSDMQAPWLNPSEMRAWRNFINSLGPLMEAFERDLTPHGLTFGDYEVLVYLSEADDRRMRMCDLAEKLRLSPSGLTRRLDGLVRNQLVERHTSPDDRRVMHAHLTDVGSDKLVQTAPEHVVSVRRHLLDLLDSDQIEHMGDIFDTVRTGLVASKQTV
jgi:DNA-binding MarR family transcriptional regulator